MMRTNAGFHADQAGRHIRQPRFDLTTRPLLTQHNSAAIIQPDDVERVLTDIDADHGTALLRFWDMACSLSLEPLAKFVAGGAGARPDHPISGRHRTLT